MERGRRVKKTMKHWGEWAQKPFIITEFYTKGMDSGLANTTGAGLRCSNSTGNADMPISILF